MKKIKTYENLEDKSTEISGITTGTVLTIEGQEYIVIENVQGNQYKVLSSDAVWKRFDDNRSNNYATSTIADYLDNDYYNNLPEIIKNAVVKTPIQQTELNTYAFINPTNWGEKNDAGTHKVFIPSWEEVTKVYGTSHYKLKAYAPDSWTWLRDIYSSDVLVVDCNGILDSSVPHINLYVRPAFVIDLSKVKYILLEGIEQEENKPFVLIKGKATFGRYDIPKVRTSGNVFEASDCKTEVIKTFNTIEEARKELDKYNTSFYLANKKDDTITATEYCLEENSKKIAYSNRNFTAFVAFESEEGLKTLTKIFPSNDFGDKAYDCCQEWALKAFKFFEEDLSVGVNEWDVKYIDSILTVEEYIKLYDLGHLLCDDKFDEFYIRKCLDKNKKEYLEITTRRNCDEYNYFDVPILEKDEFSGLKLDVQYSQHDLDLEFVTATEIEF